MWTTRNGYQPNRILRSEAEEESGRGTAIVLVRLIDWLMQQSGLSEGTPGVRDIIRVGKEQVYLDNKPVVRKNHPTTEKPVGKSGMNKPDISYVGLDKNSALTRVNIEIDTLDPRKPNQIPDSSTNHELIVNDRDHDAINIYIVIDPWTGKVKSARRRYPVPPSSRATLNRKELQAKLIPLTSDSIPALLAQLPVPHRPSQLLLPFGQQRTPVPQREREAEFERVLEFAALALEA